MRSHLFGLFQLQTHGTSRMLKVKIADDKEDIM